MGKILENTIIVAVLISATLCPAWITMITRPLCKRLSDKFIIRLIAIACSLPFIFFMAYASFDSCFSETDNTVIESFVLFGVIMTISTAMSYFICLPLAKLGIWIVRRRNPDSCASQKNNTAEIPDVCITHSEPAIVADEKLSVSGNIGQKDLHRVLLHNLKKGKKNLMDFYFLALIAFFVLLGMFRSIQSGTLQGNSIFFVVSILMITMIFTNLKRSAERMYKSRYRIENPIRMSITDDSVQLTSSRHNSIYSWSDFAYITRNKYMIIFKLSNNNEYIPVPAHWFKNDTEYALFHGRIMQIEKLHKKAT